MSDSTYNTVERYVSEKGAVESGLLTSEFGSGVGIRASRRSDVEQFKLSHTRQQNSNIGDITPVYYTDDASKVEVVLTFLYHNEEILTECGRIGAVTEWFGKAGDEWADAWREVEPNLDHDLENTGSIEEPNGTTCPRCSKTFDYLPQHLPTCQG